MMQELNSLSIKDEIKKQFQTGNYNSVLATIQTLKDNSTIEYKSKAEIEFYKGISLYKLGRLEDANVTFFNFLNKFPVNYKVFYYIGLIKLGLNDLTDGLSNFSKAIKLKPLYSKAYFQKANIYFMQNEFDNANLNYELCLKYQPNFPQAWTNLGNSYLKMNNLKKALNCYDTVIELQPLNSVAWYNKGYVNDELQMNLESVFCFSKSLELKPKNVKAWFNLGVVQSKMFQFEEALTSFNKALELNPTFIRALNDKGYLYNKMGKLGLALECFEECETLDPCYPDCLNGKGMILKRQKKYILAEDYLNQSLGLYDGFIRCFINRADLYRRTNQISKMEKEMERIEVITRNETELENIRHTPNKYLELRFYSCFHSLIKSSKKYIVKKTPKTLDFNMNLKDFVKDLVHLMLLKKINCLTDQIDMKLSIEDLEFEVSNLDYFFDFLKLHFDNFNLRRISDLNGVLCDHYKKKFLEYFLLNDLNEIKNKSQLSSREDCLDNQIIFQFKNRLENSFNLTEELVDYLQMSFKEDSGNDINQVSEIAKSHFNKLIDILSVSQKDFRVKEKIFIQNENGFGFQKQIVDFKKLVQVII